jgi:hypothetical protein
MKNSLTLLLICLCSSYIISQEKWGSYDGSIAGVNYTIVEACGDSIEVSTGNWFEKMQITTLNYTMEGAGRQIIGDSVFFKYNLLDNSAPILLYDYSLELGDTLNGNWGEFIVTDVDTEFAVGEDRKRITMVNTFDGQTDIWLYGLGSKVAGYLQPGSPIFVPDAGSEFSCYLDEQSGEFYYGDKDPSLCMLVQTGSACMTTSVDNYKFVRNIEIFPNPTDQYLTITFENSTDWTINTQLFSLNGKEILVESHEIDNLSLDVSNLASGIYLLILSQNGHQSFHKIIKQ